MTDVEEMPPLELTEQFQDALMAFSNNGGDGFKDRGTTYKEIRGLLLDALGDNALVPEFVRRYRGGGSYWQFIKHKRDVRRTPYVPLGQLPAAARTAESKANILSPSQLK